MKRGQIFMTDTINHLFRKVTRCWSKWGSCWGNFIWSTATWYINASLLKSMWIKTWWTYWPTVEFNRPLFIAHLTNISLSATNLKIITTIWIDITGGWLENMKNLSKLRIILPRNFSFDDFTSFLRVNPKLKVFQIDHININNMKSICDAIVQWCPDLENFSEIAHRDTENYRFAPAEIVNRYDFLSKLSHLKRVELATYFLRLWPVPSFEGIGKNKGY